LDEAIKGTDFDQLDILPGDFTYRNMDLLLDGAKNRVRRLSRLSRLLGPLAADYDVVILDCPPSVSLVSENVLHAADLILVPIIPATLSLRTFDQLTGFVAAFDGPRPDVLAFFSMVDRRKRLHREIAERLHRERPDIAAATIPALAVIERMAAERAPVPVFAPRSPAARCYRDLWDEVRKRAPE
jgi:cellulose biosynthesis protein BcsQ